MIISSKKQYSKLITFGCSYTSGFYQNKLAQWGEYLAKSLKCVHEPQGTDASSNYYIHSSVINYCENNKSKDYCIGIQWSEISRREIWLESINKYMAFNLATLEIGNFNIEEFDFMNQHKIFFSKIFFNIDDLIWRTVSSMLGLMSYLRQNNIDFIMFEGINSLLDFDNSKNKNFPISDNIKREILNSEEFFIKYGDMHSHMRTHELFNQDNGGHPNSDYIEWWSNEMYNYILEKS